MSKKKNAELSRMWGFAGKRHWLTIASCILAGISTVLSIIPFVCIWFVIRDILYAMKKGDLSLAASSGHYGSRRLPEYCCLLRQGRLHRRMHRKPSKV